MVRGEHIELTARRFAPFTTRIERAMLTNDRVAGCLLLLERASLTMRNDIPVGAGLGSPSWLQCAAVSAPCFRASWLLRAPIACGACGLTAVEASFDNITGGVGANQHCWITIVIYIGTAISLQHSVLWEFQ